MKHRKLPGTKARYFFNGNVITSVCSLTHGVHVSNGETHL
jgi:hypothetical protein